MSTGKGDANRRYAVHGDGLASIRDGFNELAMPEHRRAEAFSIVSEVLAANRVVDFRWYRTEVTNELACYWDDQPTNVLWVTPRPVNWGGGGRSVRGLATPWGRAWHGRRSTRT